MASRQSIQEDLKQSMLAKDELRTGTLRMLLAAVANKEKEKRYRISKAEPSLLEEELQAKSALLPEELQDAVSFEVKKRREAIEGFEKGGRKEQAEKERQEMEILLPYLPAQLSEEEIRQLVKDTIAKVGAAGPKDLGKVMGALIPQTKGKADGNLVSRIAAKLLTS
ncbi:MAG: GatB/YqeY domain-containing protein [Candidatus Wildermuthbacteria bacterium]|nr:GatB/YqeY domain-containing protein [Candidatus Wildermuthbacteria bacterium]